MPPSPAVDGPLQSRKPFSPCLAGPFRGNDSINGIHLAMYFQIPREAKRMARTLRRVMIRTVLTLVSASPAHAQSPAQYHSRPAAHILGQASSQAAASQAAPASSADISQIEGEAL